MTPVAKPTLATVIGQRIKIIFGAPSELVFESGTDGTGGSVGRYRRNEQEIYVQTGMGSAQTRETLLHELLHACTVMVNLIPVDDEDERIVNALAPVLLDALRKSPKVVAYLMEGVK